MSSPEPVPPDPSKPSRWSFATVLFALLLLIPGLCFGIALPFNMGMTSMGLAMAWLVVLITWVLVIVIMGIQHLVGRSRR